MAESDTSLYVLPVEEAWGGKLHTVTEIPGNASVEEHIYEAQWRDSVWIQGTIAAIIIILLFSLRKIVTVTPVLLGGFIRLKENFNIEKFPADIPDIHYPRNTDFCTMFTLGVFYFFVPLHP